ncbi:putative HMP/thiamine import ATP-binding protein YkoD [Oxobacter pfennigii]|uniref:Putative HMP/thiamine import ATP-binding protein YkoD n=1 Tax=Oxobacter pfennigii TaxID=36849 RepID=A0A0P8W5U8_9CLOT|nr:ABC transporter ATP-binding protein [Oxobacter pfennigii]KPU43349.1 putative HMP/thiamine import ATP-binding protein YkoD [Oxobacter pfennigii]
MIKLDDVFYRYPESSENAVDNINLTIKEGEFVLIAGPSGCGKSTLLRLFNGIVPGFYGGTIGGKVMLKGKDIEHMDRQDILKTVGMVFQDPEKQMVLQDVEREIAFGLENLVMDLDSMKRNVAESMSFLGLNEIRDRKNTEISGGQKQRVAIASVMAMDPDIVAFDEPISQLDPIGGEEVLNSIKRLNRDLGKTVVMVEQRLDRCFHLADRIIFMEDGKIIAEGSPQSIPKIIERKCHLPNITYIFKKSGRDRLPVTIREGREYIKDIEFDYRPQKEHLPLGNVVVEANKVNFEYEKGKKTLKDIDFVLHRGEIMAVMGENGAGKSTFFKIIAGLIEEYNGRIVVNGKNLKKIIMEDRIKKIGYLSQNPNDYFGRSNVFKEVAYTLENIGQYDEKRVKSLLEILNIGHLKDRNPRDLSGGEKQRVAIACTMAADPDIVILDEPTRGMDGESKEQLGSIIRDLSHRGKAVVLITHDSDFAADYATTVTLMFHGEIVAKGWTEDILYGSMYYSPQIAKIFKDKYRIVNSREAIELLKVV